MLRIFGYFIKIIIFGYLIAWILPRIIVFYNVIPKRILTNESISDMGNAAAQQQWFEGFGLFKLLFVLISAVLIGLYLFKRKQGYEIKNTKKELFVEMIITAVIVAALILPLDVMASYMVYPFEAFYSVVSGVGFLDYYDDSVPDMVYLTKDLISYQFANALAPTSFTAIIVGIFHMIILIVSNMRLILSNPRVRCKER